MTELKGETKSQNEISIAKTQGIEEIVPSRWELLTQNADIPWKSIIPAFWEYDDAAAFKTPRNNFCTVVFPNHLP